LPDSTFGQIAVRVLKEISVHETEAQIIVANYRYLLKTDFGERVLSLGGDYCRKWFAEENKNMPLLFGLLAQDWAEEEIPEELHEDVLTKNFVELSKL
jgi:hypothetical protein